MTKNVKEKEVSKMKNKGSVSEKDLNLEAEVDEVENNQTDENKEANVETGAQEKDEVTELKETIEDMKNRLLRSQADFDNYKKRARIEKEETAKYAAAGLLESLLPAIDNFERAIQSSNDTKNFDSLIQGVQMVYRQIEDALSKEGLETIEAVGKAFNPEIHQAVMQVETNDYDSGVVVEELQKGYKFKGRVIRPSMVKVNA